ncbi:hypothetical protein LEP1GSC102_4121 [Leptospira interrogans str. UI 09600]|nr:hypothetical protein LEP1GSC102_4121 [Leptospira interrogans str. UI 09600]
MKEYYFFIINFAPKNVGTPKKIIFHSIIFKILECVKAKFFLRQTRTN